MCTVTVIEHRSSDPAPSGDKFSRPAPCRGKSRATGGRDLPTPDPGRRTAQKSFTCVDTQRPATRKFRLLCRDPIFFYKQKDWDS